jgi:hypothetical protein
MESGALPHRFPCSDAGQGWAHARLQREKFDDVGYNVPNAEIAQTHQISTLQFGSPCRILGHVLSVSVLHMYKVGPFACLPSLPLLCLSHGRFLLRSGLWTDVSRSGAPRLRRGTVTIGHLCHGPDGMHTWPEKYSMLISFVSNFGDMKNEYLSRFSQFQTNRTVRC